MAVGAPPQIFCHKISPFVISQLLLQHEDFGLELVPLVEDVPQLLQGEAGSVGVLRVQADPRLLVAQGFLPQRGEGVTRGDSTTRGGEGREGRREVGRRRGYLGKILEHSRHVFIAHRLLVVNVNSDTSGLVPIVQPSFPPFKLIRLISSTTHTHSKNAVRLFTHALAAPSLSGYHFSSF